MKDKNLPSRELLCETFLDMARKMPIRKITVTDICRTAELNRSTFYDNFETLVDLKNAAVDALTKGFFYDSIALMQEPYPAEIAKTVIVALLRRIAEEKKLFRHLIEDDYTAQYFSSDVTLNFFENRFDRKHSREYEDYLLFFRAGTGSIINRWVLDDCAESPEELARSIVGILHRLFDNLD